MHLGGEAKRFAHSMLLGYQKARCVIAYYSFSLHSLSLSLSLSRFDTSIYSGGRERGSPFAHLLMKKKAERGAPRRDSVVARLRNVPSIFLGNSKGKWALGFVVRCYDLLKLMMRSTLGDEIARRTRKTNRTLLFVVKNNVFNAIPNDDLFSLFPLGTGPE